MEGLEAYLGALEFVGALDASEHLDVSSVGLDHVDDDTWRSVVGRRDGWSDSVRESKMRAE